MSRLPFLRPDDLDERGRVLWERYIAERGDRLIGESGGLIGPFNAFLFSPTITEPYSHTGDLLREETVIDRSLLELAITVVLGHWRAEFAFAGHVAMAVENGLDPAIVDDIVVGAEPRLDDDQRAIYQAATQLVATGRLDDDVYGRAATLLGDRGMVELVVAVSFYTSVAFTLNSFEVGPIPGLDRYWPD